MNSFGNKFRISLFGESHGNGVGVVMDGIAPGISLTTEDLLCDLARRKSGTKGTTPRKEEDVPEILSGVFDGHTTGAPLAILFRNGNTRSKDYSNLLSHPRPSHADLTAKIKFNGYNDHRGGGHFSGRITLALVVAGTVAKKMLGQEVVITSDIIELGGSRDSSQFDAIIESAVKDHDSVGAVIQCKVNGLGAGYGEPFFDSVESIISHLLFSIPAVKGVEFGGGFGSARLKGSENNDPIITTCGKTASNNDGGINGGITNGNDIVFRVAIKPTASIARAQQTMNMDTGKIEELIIHGRHDACIALRAGVIIEAAAAIGLAQFV